MEPLSDRYLVLPSHNIDHLLMKCSIFFQNNFWSLYYSLPSRFTFDEVFQNWFLIHWDMESLHWYHVLLSPNIDHFLMKCSIFFQNYLSMRNACAQMLTKDANNIRRIQDGPRSTNLCVSQGTFLCFKLKVSSSFMKSLCG